MCMHTPLTAGASTHRQGEFQRIQSPHGATIRVRVDEGGQGGLGAGVNGEAIGDGGHPALTLLFTRPTSMGLAHSGRAARLRAS